LRQLDNLNLHGTQQLAPHFEELATCRGLFRRHVDPDGQFGSHSVTASGKKEIASRVSGCLRQLRAEVLGLWQEAAVS
jgi:hypothetical protein